jgi:hypothetical protein
MTTAQLTALKPLIVANMAAGLSRSQAIEEAAREARMTSGDPYAFRSQRELEEMERLDAEAAQTVRDAAGVCEEFPGGEFAVPGFNC